MLQGKNPRLWPTKASLARHLGLLCCRICSWDDCRIRRPNMSENYSPVKEGSYTQDKLQTGQPKPSESASIEIVIRRTPSKRYRFQFSEVSLERTSVQLGKRSDPWSHGEAGRSWAGCLADPYRNVSDDCFSIQGQKPVSSNLMGMNSILMLLLHY